MNYVIVANEANKLIPVQKAIYHWRYKGDILSASKINQLSMRSAYFSIKENKLEYLLFDNVRSVDPVFVSITVLLIE